MKFMSKIMSRNEFEALAKDLFEGDINEKHVNQESGLMLEDFRGFDEWYSLYGEIHCKDKKIRIFAQSLGDDSEKWLLERGFVAA